MQKVIDIIVNGIINIAITITPACQPKKNIIINFFKAGQICSVMYEYHNMSI